MGYVRTIGFYFAILMFVAVALVAPAILMRIVSAPYIYTDIHDLPKSSVGLVLGASVVRGKPSPALASREAPSTSTFKTRRFFSRNCSPKC